MAFAWTDSLELGIEEIDEQHRELFRRGERLYHAMRHGQPAGADLTLASFRDFVLSHFEYEERWMERAGYQALPAHRDAHRDFADRLHRVTSEYRRQGPTEEMAQTLLQWLEAWLREHIGGDDRTLGRWSQAQGASPGARQDARPG
jgi:hemerythrin